MTVATSSPSPSPVYVRCKIASIDRVRNLIRLVVPDVGNDEYLLPANADPRFQGGDYVDATILGGQIQDIRYPPGAEPVEPPKVQTPPAALQTHSTQVTPPVTAPLVVKPKVCKLLKREGTAKVMVLNLLGKEGWFNLDESGQKNLVRLRDGQDVILGFVGIDTITKMLPATPTGDYDKDGWVKSSYGGGGGRPKDPVAEAKRQQEIVRENVLARSVELWINGHQGKICDESDEDIIIKRAEYFEGWITR